MNTHQRPFEVPRDPHPFKDQWFGIDHLALDRPFVMVVQDWGAPVGLLNRDGVNQLRRVA